MRSALFLSVPSLALVVVGCGGGDGGTALEWGGAEPHFVVQGFIGGREITTTDELGVTNPALGETFAKSSVAPGSTEPGTGVVMVDDSVVAAAVSPFTTGSACATANPGNAATLWIGDRKSVV